MSIKEGNIELYMGPKEVGGPDDLKETIIRFIGGAKKSLDIAIQELDSREIAIPIIEAQKRGVRIRIVLEADYLTDRRDADTDPFQLEGTHEENRRIHDAFLRMGIKVNADFNPQIFHQKFIIRDKESVLTGSTNFTSTGISKNLNHIIVVHSKKVAKAYQYEFNEIQDGEFGQLNKGRYKSPPVSKVSKVPIKVLFAPDHGPEMEMMKQMLKSKKRIDFAIFTFSSSSGIDDTLRFASQAGRSVTGLLEGGQANQKWAATHPLHSAGVDLFLVKRQGALGKLHHKLMVIDEQLIIAGSFNYTGPANYFNDENIIIIGDLEETNPESIAIQKRLAGYALDEIERIKSTYGQRFAA